MIINDEHQFAKLSIDKIYTSFLSCEENVVIIPEVQRYSSQCGNPGAMDALLIFGEKRNKMVCLEFKRWGHRKLHEQVERTMQLTGIATVGINTDPNHSGYSNIICLERYNTKDLHALLRQRSETNCKTNCPTIWLFKYAFGWLNPTDINYSTVGCSSCFRLSWENICSMAIRNFHKQNGLCHPFDFDVLFELFLRCGLRRGKAHAVYQRAISSLGQKTILQNA